MRKLSRIRRHWLNYRRAWRTLSRYEGDNTGFLKFSDEMKRKLDAAQLTGVDNLDYRKVKADMEYRGYVWNQPDLAAHWPHLLKLSTTERHAIIKMLMRNNMRRNNIGRVK